jgi:hypothetical protein
MVIEVARYLNNYQYDNALRLAELLYSEDASEEHLIVSLVFYRAQQ